MTSPTRGRGSAKGWHYFISLFIKMGDKVEGRGQNSQKIGDVLYGQPLISSNGISVKVKQRPRNSERS